MTNPTQEQIGRTYARAAFTMQQWQNRDDVFCTQEVTQ
jgi:hypothetical protein